MDRADVDRVGADARQGVAGRPLLAVYDVADDRRRRLVRGALRPLGAPVQRSVWAVAPIRGLTAVRLADGLSGLLAPADRLRVLRPCADCRRAAAWRPADQDPFGWLDTQVV